MRMPYRRLSVKTKRKLKKRALSLCCLFGMLSLFAITPVKSAFAADVSAPQNEETNNTYDIYGGGYAATGQLYNMGYSTEVYDATNGLPTSDAMYILGSKSGYVWIGGYAGVIRYDGQVFERMDASQGLTSARCIFEDSRGRIWVGTNDNGVVVIDGNDQTHLTHKDGLSSSSIRSFAEDNSGNVFIATMDGLCYADNALILHTPGGETFSGERVLRLDRDQNGRIFGQAGDGIIFAIDNGTVNEFYTGKDLGIEEIWTIMADPENPGMVYLGTEGSAVYHGVFGDKAEKLQKIDIAPLSGTHWINYDCNRVWISTGTATGYLDENSEFQQLYDIPFDSGIEMLTSDYQGNLWMASSTKGAMKVVTNNFVDVSRRAGLASSVANAACLLDGDLYIGTDSGLQIISKDGTTVDNELTNFIKDSRIRCIKKDKDDNLWITTFTNDLGLVRYGRDKSILSLTTKDGMPSNSVRAVEFTESGDVLVATNGGVAVVRDGRVIRTVTGKDGMDNTVVLTVEEGFDGTILAGTDGDGIYMISDSGLTKLSVDEGLSSGVVMRIKKDSLKNVLWVVTSNALQYLKDGVITSVSSFPYNNNYDLYFDDLGNAWILSSYGIYTVDVDSMIADNITEYNLYTVENGLPYAITANSYSALDTDKNLYIPGRNGVIKVNINGYYENSGKLMMDVHSIVCDDERIFPDEKGVFRIPASQGRVEIMGSVMDYTMLNPTVRMYLENGPDAGITVPLSRLTSLEYTNLRYGNYTLHLQVVDKKTGKVMQDKSFAITKKARLGELILIRVLFVILMVILAGFVVWYVMRSTIVARQYDKIRSAKEEAENANTAKSRFLANMSHEIRTPINTIKGMNEMVMREDATGVPKGYFMSVMNYSFDIRNATESLLGLINDLLDISKIESGKMHLVEKEYDTVDLFRSIVSMIRVRSTEKELTFDVVVDEIFPKRLYGDADKIKQILLNLLTNAVKYTEVGGFILNISIDERDNDTAKIRYSVKDTGMGVKEEDMEKLFTAYERLDEEKNSSIQGTGLGLDISRKFAELMGGKLWCESVYGEGSEFILTVEQRIVDASPIGAFIEHDESTPKGPYVPQFIAPDADILVVDDNPMNLNVIKGLLKATRVFVTTSTSGEDALDKIRDTAFNVVLMDHMMPGMDGVEAVARIREFDKDLPVYALTANSTAGEEFYKSKGFNGYLSKPIDSETLERTIMKHLPESMIEKPTQADAVEEITEIPEDMKWIYDVAEISVDEGIKNSGGISGFIFALKLFYDTLDGNKKVISDAYNDGNIRLYTIKVHALKSSARIIGAGTLSEHAAALEDAGNRQDMDFINSHNTPFIMEYESFKEILSRLNPEEEDDDEGKEPISEDELNEAYQALSDSVPQMDYDTVETILQELSQFKLPDDARKNIKRFSELLKTFDWDGMEELIGSILNKD